METNFFQSVAALNVQGAWTLHITNDTTGKWVVSVLFTNNALGDDARKRVPPIILNGTAGELDTGFFGAITEPVQQTAALFTNMESYLKGREQARKASQMEKNSKSKSDKSKTDKEKKYEEAMKKVDELEAEGKYKEAWLKVPSGTDYPEQAELLKERRASLSAKFAPDLFNEPKTEQPC